MIHIKLQLGCLLVILYIVISYIKETTKSKLKCNRLFDALMVVAPWAVFFDGFTAWTVNHMDIVPDALNRAAHLLFFVFMDLMIIITTLYTFDHLVGFRKKRYMLYLSIPWAVMLVMVIAGIGELKFIKGETTWYSMGFSVYVCYATLILYYGAVLSFVIARRRFLPKNKVLGTLSFIAIAGVILVVQTIFPEVLLTSIFPTILLLGIYIDFENPALRKLTMHSNEMSDAFATLVESRDNNTGGHIKRTKAYVTLMLNKMCGDRYYRRVLNRDYITNVINAAPLHDVGKIATPDSILQKPGKLTDEEYAVMKQHAAEGGEIIRQTFRELDDADFRQTAYEVARFHHEKYDGRGYPDGLKGEDIPLHARIMAVADVFDAVSQKRCYRDAMPVEECFAIIRKGRGTDFDPDLVDIFLDSKDEVIRLMNENAAVSEEQPQN